MLRANLIVALIISVFGFHELLDIALVPECDSNLISLGQLRETGITFHDNPSHMTLMRHGVVIVQAK